MSVSVRVHICLVSNSRRVTTQRVGDQKNQLAKGKNEACAA